MGSRKGAISIKIYDVFNYYSNYSQLLTLFVQIWNWVWETLVQVNIIKLLLNSGTKSSDNFIIAFYYRPVFRKSIVNRYTLWGTVIYIIIKIAKKTI